MKSIVARLLLAQLVCGACVCAGVYWLAYHHLSQGLEREFQIDGQQLALSLARAVEPHLVNHDLTSAQSALEQKLGYRGAKWAFLTSPDGQVMAHTFVPQFPEVLRPVLGGQLAKAITLQLPGEDSPCTFFREPVLTGIVGQVHLGFSQEHLLTAVNRLQWMILLVTMVLVIGGVTISSLVTRRLIRPLRWLTQATEILASGRELTFELAVQGEDEVAQLARTFNRMAREVQDHRKNLEQKVHDRTAALAAEVKEREKAEAAAWESRDRTRLLLDSTAEAIYGIDLQGRCTFANQACARILGYASSEELLGQNLHALTHHSRPDGTALPAEQCRILQAFACEQGTHLEDEVFWRADHTSFSVECWSYPIQQGGRTIGLVVTFLDITERQLNRLALEESEEKFRAISTSALDGIVMLDAAGRISFWNPAAEKLFGYTAAEVMRQPLHALLAPERFRGAHAQAFPHFQRTGQGAAIGKTVELAGRHKDGSEFPIELSVSPVRLHDQWHAVGIVRDVSEQKRAAAVLRESRQFLEEILNAMPARVFWKDTDLVYLGGNAAFARDAGFAHPQDIIGKDDCQMAWREQAELYRADDREVIETGAPKLLIEEFQTTPEGKTITLLTNKLPLRNARGEITGVLGTYLDITERKRSEQQMRLQAAALAAAANSMAITDHTGTLLWVNPAFTRLTGYSAEEAVGQNPRVLKSGQHGPEFYQTMWQTISSGQVWRGELVNQRKDGSTYTEEMTITPIRATGGDITHYIAVMQDITECRQAELARQQMEIQLRQAHKLESVGQLAAGIAHEINTPIQYIGDNTRFLQAAFGSLQQLLGDFQGLRQTCARQTVTPELLAALETSVQKHDADFLAAEVPKAIQQSLEGVERVAKIVLAMKEFSHPGTAEKSAVNLNQAIQSTVAVARSEWKYVADLQLDLDPALPTVHCLPGELNQVFLNLIINAAHAVGDVVGDGSTGKGTITVSTRREGDWVEVRVRDTGNGIPPAIRHRLFEPFFTTKPVGKGTGQGLAIAHSVIVDKHGGTLDFESEEGRGTTFIIRLPLSPSAANERRQAA